MTWGFWRQDDDPGSDPTFVFDTIDSESIEIEVEPTAHAVEDGAEINNHAVIKPRRISLSGSVTPCVLGDIPDYSTTRVTDAIGILSELADERQPIVVVSSYWTREDMIITMVNASYTHMSGERLQLSIELVQVDVVTPETTSMPLARLRSGKHRRRGSQAKEGGSDKKGAKKGAATEMIYNIGNKNSTKGIAAGLADNLL